MTLSVTHRVQFAGGSLRIEYTGTPQDLRTTPIRDLVSDEVAGFPATAQPTKGDTHE